MIYAVRIGDRSRQVEVLPDGDGAFTIAVDAGPARKVSAARSAHGEWLLTEGEAQHRLGLAVTGERFAAQISGAARLGTIHDPRQHSLSVSTSVAKGEVDTPMPGIVVRVLVQVGALVEVGQSLVVVEAMKMENEFRAPVSGKVTAVHVAAGQAVQAHAKLVSVETA